MKFLSKSNLSALISVAVLTLFTVGVSYSHSRGYLDWFEYDNSNENTPVELMSKMSGLANGVAPVAAMTACVNGSAGGYPCNNIDLMAFVSKSNMGGGNANANDIWGWVDPQNGNEYALLARDTGISFVNVTDPVNPVYLGYLNATNNGGDNWRDVKVYNNHAFVVGDGNGNSSHGMQVFDLTQLRNVTSPQNFSHTALHSGFGNAHNIVINEDTGYAYVVGSNKCSGGLYMINISNPTNPSFVGCYSGDGYTHDAQCVVYTGPDSAYNNREICFAYNEDTLTIVDVQNKSNPVQLARVPYSGSRYTHQGWVTADQKYLLMNDELDEQQNGTNTTTYIWNVSDLNNPTQVGNHVHATPAIDHNLYIHNGLVYESNYRAGLRIMDGANIPNGSLSEVAYFDVIPGSNSAQFSGNWSNYPYFPSGNVIISDIGSGLFILKPNFAPPSTKPTADFSYTKNNLAVSFTDDSTDSNGSIVGRSWTFGDGGTSTAANPSHTYATDGTYTVGLTVTDNDGETDSTSQSVTVSASTPISYCASSANNNSYEWIAGVNVANVNKTSAASSYSDFTSEVVNLNTGNTSVTLTPGFASGAYSEHWRIWIDLNQDGDFVDAGEQVYSGSGSGNVTGNLNVPASATKGATRMRVVMQYNSGRTTACGSFTYGEVEDYTANIQ